MIITNPYGSLYNHWGPLPFNSLSHAGIRELYFPSCAIQIHRGMASFWHNNNDIYMYVDLLHPFQPMREPMYVFRKVFALAV